MSKRTKIDGKDFEKIKKLRAADEKLKQECADKVEKMIKSVRASHAALWDAIYNLGLDPTLCYTIDTSPEKYGYYFIDVSDDKKESKKSGKQGGDDLMGILAALGADED